MPKIMVQPVVGKAIWFSVKDGDKYLSSMLVVFCGEIGGIRAAVQQIYTEQEHRRKGYARELVESLKRFGGGKVNSIYTSWKQSTPEGRKLMLSCDFKHEGNTFLWQRQITKPEKAGIIVPDKDIVVPSLKPIAGGI